MFIKTKYEINLMLNIKKIIFKIYYYYIKLFLISIKYYYKFISINYFDSLLIKINRCIYYRNVFVFKN